MRSTKDFIMKKWYEYFLFISKQTAFLQLCIEMKEKKLGILFFSDKNPLEKANFLNESK